MEPPTGYARKDEHAPMWREGWKCAHNNQCCCIRTRKAAFVGRALVHPHSVKQDWSVEAYSKESDADKWPSGSSRGKGAMELTCHTDHGKDVKRAGRAYGRLAVVMARTGEFMSDKCTERQ